MTFRLCGAEAAAIWTNGTSSVREREVEKTKNGAFPGNAGSHCTMINYTGYWKNGASEERDILKKSLVLAIESK